MVAMANVGILVSLELKDVIFKKIIKYRMRPLNSSLRLGSRDISDKLIVEMQKTLTL